MKLVCKESFEQGLKAKLGGTFKLLVGEEGGPAEYAIQKAEPDKIYQVHPPGWAKPVGVKATSAEWYVLVASDGRIRLIGAELVAKWKALGVAELVD